VAKFCYSVCFFIVVRKHTVENKHVDWAMTPCCLPDFDPEAVGRLFLRSAGINI